MGLAGKTIASVSEIPYGTYRMAFTDGTYVDIAPEGYEADDVSFIERTHEDIERMRVEDEQKEYRRKVEAERRERLREAKRVEMQQLCTPAQYERWLAERDTPAPFLRAMQMEYNAALKAQLNDVNRLFFGA